MEVKPEESKKKGETSKTAFKHMECRLCVIRADDDRRNAGEFCNRTKRDRGIRKSEKSIRIGLTVGLRLYNFELVA